VRNLNNSGRRPVPVVDARASLLAPQLRDGLTYRPSPRVVVNSGGPAFPWTAVARATKARASSTGRDACPTDSGTLPQLPQGQAEASVSQTGCQPRLKNGKQRKCRNSSHRLEACATTDSSIIVWSFVPEFGFVAQASACGLKFLHFEIVLVTSGSEVCLSGTAFPGCHGLRAALFGSHKSRASEGTLTTDPLSAPKKTGAVLPLSGEESYAGTNRQNR
jgi:hypothetical protein